MLGWWWQPVVRMIKVNLPHLRIRVLVIMLGCLGHQWCSANGVQRMVLKRMAPKRWWSSAMIEEKMVEKKTGVQYASV